MAKSKSKLFSKKKTAKPKNKKAKVLSAFISDGTFNVQMSAQGPTGFMWVKSTDDFEAMVLDQCARDNEVRFSKNDIEQIQRMSIKLLDRLGGRDKNKRFV